MKEESEGKTAIIELQVTQYRKKFYITHQLNTFSALQCHYWNCELRFEAVLSLKHKETFPFSICSAALTPGKDV